ncbi:hypothetical protein CBQ26_03205 [Deinococcus indicus]|uniref:VWFA domain-containing protein n=1 Tax=Deinococcus indicus TaxID=223556 RepID=A0A246BNT7_9DEIO|nr:vWA domain-containing protein [Deinococcus indicus]OWL97323.1 hypothetical protein CBQ26_03205 [Deinococcus indicus]GHG32058.1 hypothetical protein GCM10017784_26730 [Deinococcus indicus]
MDRAPASTAPITAPPPAPRPGRSRPLTALLLTCLLLNPTQTGAAQTGTPQSGTAQTRTAQTTQASGAAAVQPACALPAGPLPTRTRAVIVLDTSGSMRGLGDGRADIFEQVKASVDRYVQVRTPDELTLITFDGGLRTRRTFSDPARNPDWTAALAATRADGNNTYLYRSLRAALQPLTPQPDTLTTVFVLTDGIDNDSAATAGAAQAALDAFTARGPLDRLHYVALGTDIPAAARAALEGSDYASGLTLPLRRIPDLTGQTAAGTGLEGGLLTITDPAAADTAFPPGTPLTLAVSPGARNVRLNTARLNNVPADTGRLNLTGPVQAGAAALLCAPPSEAAGQVAPRARRVLLRLTGSAPLLTWLNPGEDRTLKAGEHATLRYRAAPGLPLEQASVRGAAGLRAEVRALPGSRELSVQFMGLDLPAGQSVTPTLLIPGLPPQPLPALTGAAGGRLPTVPPVTAPVTPTPPTTEPTTGPAGGADSGRAPSPLAALVGLALAAALLLGWRARRKAPAPAARPARPAPPTPVEGLEYRDDRTLALVGADGEVSSVPTPLGGPFDLGQMARVPHLSGLRAEQHRDGLRILRFPPDLEVSQGTRLLNPGDVVRPGTLLGVAVARRSRAPHPTLGSLAGLGLPLALHSRGPVLHVRGPYGEHALRVHAPVTDLGEALRAPALEGLSVSLSGRDLLLLHAPDTLQLRVAGENTVLTPGTPLPPHAVVDFLG